MTRWLTIAAAAALLASTGACKSNGSGSGGSMNSREEPANSGANRKMDTSVPEGRRGDNPPRARSADETAPSGTAATANPAGGESSGLGTTSQTTSGESSGLNAEKAPATGTTPGGQGVSPSNGTGTDDGSGSTRH